MLLVAHPVLLALSLACVGPGALPSDDEIGASEESTDASGPDSSGGSTTNTDTSTIDTSDCYPAPEECLRFIECVDAIVPGQGRTLTEIDGESGECWCGSEREAVDCPDDQLPLINPEGLPGSFCAPACTGLDNACPEHGQTSANGTCYFDGQPSLCAMRCYVDSAVVGGTQCQCGATCQPHGAPDGEGYLRGICTFD